MLWAAAFRDADDFEVEFGDLKSLYESTYRISRQPPQIETQDGESAVSVATLVTKSRIDPELVKLSLPPAVSVKVGGCYCLRR
jgi:hypothetical protein